MGSSVKEHTMHQTNKNSCISPAFVLNGVLAFKGHFKHLAAM